MKRFYKFLMPLVAIVALALPLSVQAQITTFPYLQDFESGMGGWSVIDADNDGENWGISDGTSEGVSNAHSGTHFISSWSYDMGGSYDALDPDNWLVSPAITVDGTQALSFWVIHNCSSYPDKYSVYVATDSTTTAFLATTPIHTQTLSGGNTWTEVLLPLSGYTGTIYIAFRHYDSEDNCGIYIDDIRVAAAPTCFAVQSVMASDITSSGMTISWVDTVNTSTTYTLTYTDGGTDTTVVTSISDTSYTLTGLDAQTNYWFSVLPDCDDGTIAPATGSTRTDCDNGSCNFTVEGTDSYGDGWNGNTINFMQGGSLMGSATIASGNAETTQIQVCSGDTVTVTFTSGSWASEMGGSIKDGGGNVVFTIANMGDRTDGDILAVVADPCPSCIAPTALTIDSVTTEDIYLHWTAGGSESSWSLTINDSLVADASSNSYVFNNLNINTLYTIGVASLCDEGDTSAYISITARTLAGAPISEFPYTCGFEYDSINDVDQAAIWVLENGDQTNQWFVGTATHNTGTKALYISNDNGTSYSYSNNSESNVWAYAAFSFNPGEYTISFNWNANGESCCDYLRAYVFPADGNVAAGSSSAPSGAVQLGGTMNYVSSWQNYSGTFTISEAGSYKVAFLWHNDGSVGTNPPAAIDNIYINLNTCPAPVALTIDSLMPTAIDVHWTTVGEEAEWAIRIGDSLITGITDTAYTITGLEQYTLYTMSVYAVCGIDDTSLASAPVTGRTTVSCPWPTNLTVNVSGDTADFSWNGSASAWELVVVDMGATPGSASTVYYPTANSYQLTGLDTGFFDAYVRADCGGDYSLWTGPVSFNHGVNFMNMATTGTDTLRSCAAIVYDDGGPTGNYSSNCQSTLVILPGNSGGAVVIGGTSYTESSYDYLTIYAGVGTNGEQLWSDYGVSATQTFGPFTGDAFTVVFHSDNTVQYSGFQINVACRSIDCPYANEIHTEQVSAGSAVLGYTLVGVSDTSTYDDITLVLTSATDTLTFSPTSDNQAVVTGLDSNTTYVAQLFTSCGGIATDAVTCTFTTKTLPCAAVDTSLTDTVQIGNGTNTSYYIPIGNFYNYSYTQQLILASELSGAMNISGLDFQYAYSSPTTDKNNVSIYMANVSQTSLSGSFVPYSSSFTLVYTGALNCTTGWNHFEFDDPFSYDGTSNLLIVVHDNSGDYNGSSYTFNTHSANGMGRYVQNDGSAYDINTVSGGYVYDYRANMKLYTTGCLQQATCAAPLVVVDSTTTTSAIVGIYPGFQETSWTVEYRLAGDSTWTLSGNATATTYTVSGLQSGKHYEIRVSSECDGASFGTMVTVTTQCAQYVVTPTNPYFENFESGAPFCWSQEYVRGQYNWRLGSETYVYHNTTYQHGEGAAELYQQSNQTDTAITKLITDAFDFTALTNGARLRFYNAQLPYQTYGQPTLYLYYRTSSSDPWTVFDSIVTAVTDFTQHEFLLPNSVAAPYYQIAFEGHCPFGYGLNVDDVLVEAAPRCTRPTVDTVMTNGATATISWTGNASSYIVSYHNYYDTVAPWTTVNVTGTSTTITGLTTGNYYEVTVTGDCGATDGQSDPSAPAYFYVPCAGQAIPYTENFDSYTSDLCYIDNAASAFAGYDNYPYVQLPNCWMFPNQSHQGISPAALLFHDTVNSFPTNCLWINARTGRDHYSVLPLMDAPIDTLVLLFDYQMSSESIVIGVVTDPNDVTTFIGLDTLTDASGSAEHYFSTDAFSWNAGQDYYIAFHTFGSYYAFLDNIQVVYQPNCMKVANLHQVSATSSSVTLDWTNSSTGATPVAYQISYTAQGTTTPNYSVSTTKPATLSGLATLTSYTVAVRPICGAGDTAFWSDELGIMTEMCDNATTVVNFDSTAATTTSYGPIGNSCYNNSYVQILIDSAQMAGVGGDITAFAFLPVNSAASYGNYFTNMDVYMANVSETSFSDFIHPDTNHVFHHVISNGNFNFTDDTWQTVGFDSTFTWDGHSSVLFAVNRAHGSWSCSANFSAHTGTGYKMVYDHDDYSTFDINTATDGSTSTTVGDLKLISCGAGCSAPVVSNTTVTYQSADITVIGSGNGYELTYGTDPSVQPNSMTSTTGVFQLNGLMPETQYFYSVRALCDSGNVSNWNEGYFITDSLPCMAPGTPTVTGTSYNHVFISWTPGGNESNYLVHVFNNVYDAYDTVYGNTHMTAITGLMSGVTYYATVSSLCGDIMLESEPSDTISFTTDVCQPVEGITVSDITASSATVSWQSMNGSTGYTLYYGFPGFTTDEAQRVSVAGTASSYTLTDLNEETNYQLLMINRCAEGVESAASDRVDFTTTAGGNGIYDVENGTLTLFPNPASSVVTVTVSGFDGEVEVQIVDMNGRAVSDFRTQNSELTLDVSELAQGAYFVRVTGDKSTAVRKLIVR